MRSILPVLAILIVVILALLPPTARARSKYPDFPQGSAADVIMLGERIESIRAGGGTMHLVYLHGMRASEANHSRELRDAIVKRFSGTQSWMHRKRVDLGTAPVSALFARTAEVWRTPDLNESEQRWLASRPFVDRHVMR